MTLEDLALCLQESWQVCRSTLLKNWLLVLYFVLLVMSCFPDSLWSFQPCIGVCAYEEAVTSSSLYSLALAGKLFTSTWKFWAGHLAETTGGSVSRVHKWSYCLSPHMAVPSATVCRWEGPLLASMERQNLFWGLWPGPVPLSVDSLDARVHRCCCW